MKKLIILLNLALISTAFAQVKSTIKTTDNGKVQSALKCSGIYWHWTESSSSQ